MQVVIAPDQRLRIKTKPVKKVTPHLLKTIKEMVRLTKTFVDPEGVGLASTQIGEDEQYFVMKYADKTFKTVFNPKILSYSKATKIYFEGCLSIPNYYGQVTRHLSVRVTYQDEKGDVVKERLTGIKAWIFQHEYDHLQGKLFMDKVLEEKSRLFKVAGRDRAGAEIFEEVSI
jgi:peptide deformylase